MKRGVAEVRLTCARRSVDVQAGIRDLLVFVIELGTFLSAELPDHSAFVLAAAYLTGNVGVQRRLRCG